MLNKVSVPLQDSLVSGGDFHDLMSLPEVISVLIATCLLWILSHALEPLKFRGIEGVPCVSQIHGIRTCSIPARPAIRLLRPSGLPLFPAQAAPVTGEEQGGCHHQPSAVGSTEASGGFSIIIGFCLRKSQVLGILSVS